VNSNEYVKVIILFCRQILIAILLNICDCHFRFIFQYIEKRFGRVVKYMMLVIAILQGVRFSKKQ